MMTGGYPTNRDGTWDRNERAIGEREQRRIGSVVLRSEMDGIAGEWDWVE